MPSICGLDHAAWQETCDYGAVVFLAMGVGPCGEPCTMPLWSRQLGRPALLSRLAVGSQVQYCQPLIPTLRGPKGDSPYRGLP